MFNRQSRRSFSKYVSKIKGTSPDVRRELRITELMSYNPPNGHSHPMSAKQRTAVSMSMSDAVRQAGFEPYVVSMGMPDQLKKMRGSRMFYTDKDLKLQYQDDPVQHNDVIVTVDVDYHAPMPGYLRYFRPIMMYTLQPKHAAYANEEYSYHIEDDVVTYLVAGGAKYQHRIWDYDHDVVSAEYKGWVNYFEVDQREVTAGLDDGGHRLITLVPLARLPVGLDKEIQSARLCRKMFSQKGVSMVYDGVSRELSISISGSRSAVRVPIAVYSSLQERLASKTTGAFTVGDVEVFLVDKAGPDKKVASATVYGALTRLGLRTPVHTNLMTTASVIKTYRPIGSLSLGDSIEPVQLVSQPLVTEPALFPERCHDSAEASIKGRVLAVRNDKIPNEAYLRYASEFIQALVPDELVGTGMPLDLDAVIAKQNGPLQRGRIERTMHNFGLEAPNRLETFVKAEAYMDVTDPRNITTCRPEFTVEMSRYVYAFKQDILLHLGWYGPGKTPVEAIDRFREFGQNGFIVTDYSRFDGTVSQWLQNHVVRAAYCRWVCPDERNPFIDYFQKVFLPRARSDQGFEYDPGYGTRSGSPITTDGNTMVNAYVHYAALRSAGMDKALAWERLGLFAGDDGLAPNIECYAAMLPLVVADLGLKVKMSVAGPNERITYLGRVFPHPLTHVDSHQEAMRTLSKIHLSANKTVTPEQAAVNKAQGYMVTDSLTPIVGDWARSVLRENAALQPKGLLRDEMYKIESGAWPQADADVVRQSFANELGMTVVEVMGVAEAVGASQPMTMPALIENTRGVKIPAIVGDVVVEPEPAEQCPPVQAKRKRRRKSQRAALDQPSTVSSSDLPVPAAAQAVRPVSPPTKKVVSSSKPLPTESKSSTASCSPGRGKSKCLLASPVTPGTSASPAKIKQSSASSPAKSVSSCSTPGEAMKKQPPSAPRAVSSTSQQVVVEVHRE